VYCFNPHLFQRTLVVRGWFGTTDDVGTVDGDDGLDLYRRCSFYEELTKRRGLGDIPSRNGEKIEPHGGLFAWAPCVLCCDVGDGGTEGATFGGESGGSGAVDDHFDCVIIFNIPPLLRDGDFNIPRCIITRRSGFSCFSRDSR